jgi:hypothetical protein
MAGWKTRRELVGWQATPYRIRLLRIWYGTPGYAQSSLERSISSIDFQEHLEDLEHDQARHQGIHSHGRSETCYNQRASAPPGSTRKSAL